MASTCNQIKITLPFIICLMCHTGTTAQFEFIADKQEKQPPFRLDSLLESHFPVNSSDVELEFRLWTNPSLIDYADVFIMQLKSGIWSAKYFEYTNGKFTSRKVRNEGLDTLWDRIRHNQVLTLPDQDSLRWLMRKYFPDTTYVFDSDGEYLTSHMTDGTGYRFKIFSKAGQRTYRYHCPAGHLRRYSNIQELYRAYAIIILIQKHLGKPLVVC